ncbi:MAG: leucine-rich repeat domain-containing protein [Oscillospiraceae bacterium]|nr:leucine-rich repeat domain-containing protein [Oscillospiraceae bacterium]
MIETANASISTGAFQNCTNLKSVQLPDVLREIGDEAFKNCTGLTDIRFPYMLDSIGSRAFADCTALKRVILPQDCERLRSGAFQNCTALTYVGFPYTYNGAMQISYDVFSGCPKNITVAAPALSDAYYFAKSHGYPFREYTNIRLQDDKAEAVTAKSGETVRFTVHPVNESKNDDSLTYQWMHYDGELWRDLTWTGAKTPTLSVPVDASRESWLYECRVYTGSGSCTISRSKRIIVKAAVTQQPAETVISSAAL